MLLSTQTEVLAARHGDEEAIRILARAGFDAYDFSMFRMFQDKEYALNTDLYREYAENLRRVADEAGIVCNQAHAPFHSSTGEEPRDTEIFNAIVRSMEVASILGAKIIVVHPKQHLNYMTDAEELKRLNYEFYTALIPYCEKFNIRVACENMWKYNKIGGRIIDSTCSRPAEFCEYIDMIDSPWIVACLDVGHAVLTDEDLPTFVRTLGAKRLQALHVHDNDFINDTHALPFTERIDFRPLCRALKEIGYEGDFTYEADTFIKRLPEIVEADALHLMEKVGRYLISII